jgi:ABC-type lipoprotein export system ATPase subunit/ABC-type antimicrobial peptide transport system permease subunit
MDLLRLENITKTYHLGEIDVPVLKGVSFTIRRGEMVALMGASGSGKSTLMNILGCLDHPTSGQYWLDGQEISDLSPNQRALVRTAKLGFVFQSFNLLPRTTALNNVLMPLDYSVSAPSAKDAHARAVSLLNRVGLSERLDHVPSQMSGGQQQRVAIARSLINQPTLLLADEPTGNLDSHTSVEILQMFQQLNAAGITVVLVTHDSKVAGYAHRVIRVVDGLIVEDSEHAPTKIPPPVQSTNGNGHAHASSPSGLNGAHPGDANEPGFEIVEEIEQSARKRAEKIANGNGAAHSAYEPSDDDDHDGGLPALAGLPSGGGSTATAVAAKPASRPALKHAAVAVAEESAPAAEQRPRHAERRGWSGMWLLPAPLRTAVVALRRNKMRSALTALGVIIGVGAVIAMVEISTGSRTALMQTMSTMGANMIMVRAGAAASGGISWGGGSGISLTANDADEIAKLEGVEAVAPSVRVSGQVVHGNRNWVPGDISGTTASYLTIRDWGLDEGDMFTDRDVRNTNKVCVVGQTIVKELFDGESPVGQDLRVKNVALRVVGVLSRKGANTFGMDQDDTIILPWTTTKYRVSDNSPQNRAASPTTTGGTTTNTLNKLYPNTANNLYPPESATAAMNNPQATRVANVDQIYVKARSAADIPTVMAGVKALLRQRHRLRAEEVDDFTLRDMSEIVKAMGSMSEMMGGLLLIVAFISLAVGGVGIMNIMLVSVTERTREIGLRMAVGARSFHILRQFLIEAIMLCLFGGLLGVLLGRCASLSVWYTLRWPIEASWGAIIAAFMVSATIGIAFGFYPAWKASRLDPIEALRYE